MKKTLLCLMLLISVMLPPLYAQTTPPPQSGYFDMTGFPQWTRDLRRGSIIAFGVFPFTYLLSSISVDTYRWASSEGGLRWDNRQYAPWPLTSAGGVSKTQDQMFLTLGIAAGSAVLIAVIDHGIERNRRNRREREMRRYPEGTPIIIQRPLHDAETPEPSAEADPPPSDYSEETTP